MNLKLKKSEEEKTDRRVERDRYFLSARRVSSDGVYQRGEIALLRENRLVS